MSTSSNSSTTVAGHFINGEVSCFGNDRIGVLNPATGELATEVELADEKTVNVAITAAQQAFPSWRNTPPQKRAQILFKYKQLLEENADRLCALIANEHGKVLDDARGELGRGIEVVEYACGISELLKGEYSKNAGPGIDSWSEFQPLGVVAGVTPFNFPAMVPMWMFPMAIACGNTFVLKPSEQDPSTALLLAQLFHDAGLPAGAFNVVNGDKSTVDALLKDERVTAVSFVGSTPVAESIYKTATDHGKRVQALGGAKNHAVIMPDADIENAVDALMGAAYGSCGERCMAISVAVCVGNELADKVVAQLKARVSALKIGPGSDVLNDMGPLINQAALDRVLAYLDSGVKEGAELVVDGRMVSNKSFGDGFFIGGSLFDRVKSGMRIYNEEIFGPVLCVVRVETLQEAMTLINDHEYGNGCCIFTREGETARVFSDSIKVGMVGVNVALPVPIASQSFGGWKRSLFGDLYVYGPDAIRFYTRRKTITQRWPSNAAKDGAKFSFPSS
ncbi:MAG: CoA-acylating methylmalonate-semialdehyde dehydrogenase [Pseudohongiellaceae bacterium]